jgi:hypothetical protein
MEMVPFRMAGVKTDGKLAESKQRQQRAFRAGESEEVTVKKRRSGLLYSIHSAHMPFELDKVNWFKVDSTSTVASYCQLNSKKLKKHELLLM